MLCTCLSTSSPDPSVSAVVSRVIAVTGDLVTLSCTPSGIAPSQSAIRWKVNGTYLTGSRSISMGTSTMLDLRHTYTLTRATPQMGGLYECELASYPTVSASINVTIAPGKRWYMCLCVPFCTAFVPCLVYCICTLATDTMCVCVCARARARMSVHVCTIIRTLEDVL